MTCIIYVYQKKKTYNICHILTQQLENLGGWLNQHVKISDSLMWDYSTSFMFKHMGFWCHVRYQPNKQKNPFQQCSTPSYSWSCTGMHANAAPTIGWFAASDSSAGEDLNSPNNLTFRLWLHTQFTTSLLNSLNLVSLLLFIMCGKRETGGFSRKQNSLLILL